MKRRLFALLLALGLLLPILAPSAGRAAIEGVYFTAANELVLPLDANAMPFYSGGTLYVPSRLFDGTDLGVLYVRNDIMGLAILYTNKIDLRFDLDGQIVYDKQGKIYSGYHAIEQNGVVFLPLNLVCRYFGLTWSYNETETAPLIRVKSSTVILDDRRFIDAAATQMRDYYAEYERAMAASEPVLPPAPSTDDPPLAAEGQTVYLLVESTTREDTLAVLDALDGVQATFLLSLEQLEGDGELARALVSGGHGVALLARAETEPGMEEEIEQARALLWQSACTWLELVWYEGPAQVDLLLEDLGCVRLSAELDQRSAPAQPAALLRSIGRHREDLGVHLGTDGACREDLPALVSALEEGRYRLCAWRLTA